MANPSGPDTEVTLTLEHEDSDLTADPADKLSSHSVQAVTNSCREDVDPDEPDSTTKTEVALDAGAPTPDLVLSSRKKSGLTENPEDDTSESRDDTVEQKDQKVTKSPTVRFSYSPKGENSEAVEVIEFADTEMTEAETAGDGRCSCGLRRGPHIVVFSILCFPVAMVISLLGSFYFGAMTWYNLLIYFNEERTVWHKIFICPVLILTFPISVGLTSLGISLYAACVQISCSFLSWRQEILDTEKGFYGWLCEKLDLPMCSPYDVVTYNDESELEPMKT